MRKVIFYISYLILFLSTDINAQFSTWQWAKEANSSNDELGWDICYDKVSGSAYVAGYFEGGLSAEFGSSFSNTNGQRDGFVAKYSPLGNVLWAFKVGGSSNEEIKSIASDPFGNIYIAGNYNSTTDFDPSAGVYTLSTLGGSQTGFLAKYTGAGNFVWALRYGGNSSQDLWKIFADSNYIYLTGSFNSFATFYSTNNVSKNTFASQGGKNFYGAKYNPAGVIQWVVSGGSSKDDEGMDVVADANKVYFTGYYKNNYILYSASGTASSTLQVFTQDKEDMFVAAYDQAGSLSWATNGASQDQDVGHGIAQDANNIYVAGSFRNDNISFPYPSAAITKTNLGGQDIFVASLSKTNGSYLWVSSETGSGNNDEIPYEIEVSNNGNILLAGYFVSNLNFSSFGGPLLTSAGNEDIFLTSLNSNGNFVWATKAGGPSTDILHGLCVSPADEIYITGDHSNSAVFGNIILSNASGNNFFIAKTGCGIISNNLLPGTISVCEGNSVTITGSTPFGILTGSYNFNWEESNDNASWIAAIGTCTNQNYASPSLNTSLYYRRIVSALTSCAPALSNTILVKVDKTPSVADAGPNLSVCSSSAILVASQPVNGSGSWSLIQGYANIPAGSSSNSIIVTGLSPGAATLRWTISSGTCASNHDDIIITRDLPPDMAIAGPDQHINVTATVLSANTPSAGSGYWTVIEGTGFIANPGNPNSEVTGLSDGDNIFRWHTKNGVCRENTDDILIYVPPLEIPNGFSPNEDGVNDHFEIPAIESISNVIFKVYNRWGSLVYSNDQYKNTWKGTNMNNERLSDDTYFYTLEIPSRKNYSGYIILKKNK